MAEPGLAFGKTGRIWAEASREPAPGASDAGGWLRGRTVRHTLVVSLASPKLALVLLLADLAATPGELRALTVKPVHGRGFEAVLQIDNLDAEAARELAGRFASRASVVAAAVEHMLVC